MTILTVTPNVATGSHQLSIRYAYPVTRIQRTDANGSYDVRTLPDVLPTAPVNMLTNGDATSTSGFFGIPGTSGVSAMSVVSTGGVDGGAFVRQTWTTANTGGGSAGAYVSSTAAAGSVGDVYGGSYAVRFNKDVTVTPLFRLNLVATTVAQTILPDVLCPANTWVIMDCPEVVGDEPFDRAQLYPLIKNGQVMNAGDTMDLDKFGLFDGGLPELVLDDYEAANGSATYTVTSPGGNAVQATSLPLGAPWLGVPVTPQFSARLESIQTYGAGMDSRSTVLEPDGSPFPLVIGRSASSRRGSMDLWAGSYADALDLLRLCMRPSVMFLRQADHPGMDMFFHAPAAEITTLSTQGADSKFGVKVQYIEVPRPGAALSGGLGWTWEQLKNTYATWGDVFNAFDTWGDVRTNRPNS